MECMYARSKRFHEKAPDAFVTPRIRHGFECSDRSVNYGKSYVMSYVRYILCTLYIMYAI